MRFIQIVICSVLLLLSACGEAPANRAFGTLERNRITLVAPVNEAIDDILVTEGELVTKGDILLTFDTTLAIANLHAKQSQLAHVEAQLDELIAGPRQESLREEGARLSGLKAELANTKQQLQRIQTLFKQGLVDSSALDNATTQYQLALSHVEQSEAVLLALNNGTRAEQLRQTEALVAVAKAELDAAQKHLDNHTLHAPNNAIVDALPWHKGDRIAAGAIAITLEEQGQPYARVYLPGNHLSGLANGTAVTLHIDGLTSPLQGQIQNIRTHPAFTPYFALNERDRAGLMYLARVQFNAEATSRVALLPSGVGLEVELP